jgi:hypothetical protein
MLAAEYLIRLVVSLVLLFHGGVVLAQSRRLSRIRASHVVHDRTGEEDALY